MIRKVTGGSKKKFSGIHFFLTGACVGFLLFYCLNLFVPTMFFQKAGFREMFAVSNCYEDYLLLKELNGKQYANAEVQVGGRIEKKLLLLSETDAKATSMYQSDRRKLLEIKDYLEKYPIHYSSKDRQDKIFGFLNQLQK